MHFSSSTKLITTKARGSKNSLFLFTTGDIHPSVKANVKILLGFVLCCPLCIQAVQQCDEPSFGITNRRGVGSQQMRILDRRSSAWPKNFGGTPRQQRIASRVPNQCVRHPCSGSVVAVERRLAFLPVVRRWYTREPSGTDALLDTAWPCPSKHRELLIDS